VKGKQLHSVKLPRLMTMREGSVLYPLTNFLARRKERTKRAMTLCCGYLLGFDLSLRVQKPYNS